jgi:hypothetical protein
MVRARREAVEVTDRAGNVVRLFHDMAPNEASLRALAAAEAAAERLSNPCFFKVWRGCRSVRGGGTCGCCVSIVFFLLEWP